MATQLAEAPRVVAAKKRPAAGTVHWFNECVARGKREVFSEVTTLTPGLAATLLGLNPDNRNIRAVKASQFAADMRAGRWAFNGEAIKISRDGLLNDGQHRLSALIDANVTLPILFTFGVERDTRMTLDQGAARTAADYLGMDGIQNATASASIARLVIAAERENLDRLGRENDITNTEIRQRVLTDEKIGEAAHYAATVNRFTNKFAAPAIIGTAFYLLSEVSATDAKAFMDMVAIGEGLRRNDPAFAVRDTLLSVGKGKRQQKLAAIFHGWNKYRCGLPLKVAKATLYFPALV